MTLRTIKQVDADILASQEKEKVLKAERWEILQAEYNIEYKKNFPVLFAFYEKVLKSFPKSTFSSDFVSCNSMDQDGKIEVKLDNDSIIASIDEHEGKFNVESYDYDTEEVAMTYLQLLKEGE